MEEEEASWVTASSFRTSCSAVPFEVDYAVYEKKIYLLNKNYRDFKLYLQCEKFPHLFHFSRGGQCMGVHKTHANKDPPTHTHTHTHTHAHTIHTHTHTYTHNEFYLQLFQFHHLSPFSIMYREEESKFDIYYICTHIHTPTHPPTHTHTHTHTTNFTYNFFNFINLFFCLYREKKEQI